MSCGHTVLVTGSGGHLGEAIVRALRGDAAAAASVDADALRPFAGAAVVGLDRRPTAFTDAVLDLTAHDAPAALAALLRRHHVTAVVHTAALQKPHVATHGEAAFVDVNVTGTLRLLEAAWAAPAVAAFVLSSSTTVYGHAVPRGERAASAEAAGAAPVWLTEAVTPVPRNIYGVTKVAAEHLCGLYHRKPKPKPRTADAGLVSDSPPTSTSAPVPPEVAALPSHLHCVALRNSRFFLESDDEPAAVAPYGGSEANLKTVELLHRRVDIADVVAAHLRAIAAAPVATLPAAVEAAGCRCPTFIVSAPTPLRPEQVRPGTAPTAAASEMWDAVPWADNARRRLAAHRNWVLPPTLDRVYDASAAVQQLGWRPRYTFDAALAALPPVDVATGAAGGAEPAVHFAGYPCSPLARTVGCKGYHYAAA